MNILFLTLADFRSFSEHNIYCDLLRAFQAQGHQVYCISPAERRLGIETHFEEDGHLLKLKIGNTQKTGIIEKGISTVMIEPQFIAAIKKYFADVRFDLVLYSTPPITLVSAIRYVQKRDGAKTYLLLKDIFPQNAVDLGMLSRTGPKGLLHSFFRNKEKTLYTISDVIGCMSQANVDFLLKQDPQLDPGKVEICPNSVEPQDMSVDEAGRKEMRQRYGLPLDKTIFVYGGNLGKIQSIPYLVECLRTQKDNDWAHFLIVGAGVDRHILEEYVRTDAPRNVTLMANMPKDDYDRLVGSCDVGMIVVDHRFTIPNFPSRLLSYMQAKLPVFSVTDVNTDIGQVCVDNGFGWWCESRRPEDFAALVEQVRDCDLQTRRAMGDKAWEHLLKEYTVQRGRDIIMAHFKK